MSCIEYTVLWATLISIAVRMNNCLLVCSIFSLEFRANDKLDDNEVPKHKM